MAKTSKKLQKGLKTVQSRLSKQAQAEQARKTAEQKARKPAGHKAKTRSKVQTSTSGTTETKSLLTNPFKSRDTVLLIGEGDFSFARALIRSGHKPDLITATAYDSESICYEKYPEAPDTVKGLRESGAEVVFGVDATKIGASGHNAWGRGRAWDKVVWNFPHIGAGIADQDRNVRANQELILKFLVSATKVLVKGTIPLAHSKSKKRKGKAKARLGSDDDDSDEDAEDVAEETRILMNDRTRGTVLITLHNVPPYTLWDIPRLARSQTSFALLRSFAFDREKYANEGYEHRLTKGGTRARGKEGSLPGDARTWEFWAQAEDD